MTRENKKPMTLKDKTELTGRSLMCRLREAVDPPGKRSGWMAALNDKQLAEVYHRLRLNQPMYRIAKVCMDDWGFEANAMIKSVIRAIRSFRDKVLSPIEQERLNPSPPAKEPEEPEDIEESEEPEEPEKPEKRRSVSVVHRAEKIAKKLDAMGRMAWLIEMQTDRIESLMRREAKSLPFKMTDASMSLLSDMLEKYVQLQIKLGVLDSKPSEYNFYIKNKFESIMQHSVTPGTAMPELCVRWLKKCEENALTLTENADGSFGIAEEGSEEEDYEGEEQQWP